jgi:peptide-methionine (S)-S-oxide reductase
MGNKQSSKAAKTPLQTSTPQPKSKPITMSISGMSTTVSLGAGCYWGTEKYVKIDFQKKFPGSIKSARVGFMSPEKDHPEDPSYRQVCTGSTGHVEVLHVELNDPANFEDLIKFFFLFHDPTTMNRQGNDTGTQYASAIFVNDEQQKQIVEKVISDLQDYINANKSPYTSKQIATQIHEATKFYAAEEYHQEYLMKNPSGYCNHRMRFKDWPLN